MMNCRIEIDLFYPNEIGGFTGAGSVTETFSAQSCEAGYDEFFAVFKKLRSKRHPEPFCIKGKLTMDGHEVLSVDECFKFQQTLSPEAQAELEGS